MASRVPAGLVRIALAAAPAMLGLGLLAACGGAGGPTTPPPTPTPTPPPPNIVFIQADDLEAQGIGRMPQLESLLTRQGTRFANSFAALGDPDVMSRAWR